MADSDDELLRELGEMNDGDEQDERQPRTIRGSTRKSSDRAWADFVEYIHGDKEGVGRKRVHLLPEGTINAADLLGPSSATSSRPHVRFAVLAGYMAHWASRAASLIADVPTVKTAVKRYRDFCHHYLEHRGDGLPSKTRRLMSRFIKKDMVRRGLIAVVKRKRGLTSPDGYRQTAKAAFSPNFASHHTRKRFQACFFLASTVQTSLRGAASLPLAQDEREEKTTTYSCYTMVVQKRVVEDPTDTGSTTPHVYIDFVHPRNKTSTTENAVHSLVQSDELWKCPVFWFILLATLDNALPVSAQQLFSNDILAGEDRIEIKCLKDQDNTPVFRHGSQNAKVRNLRTSWTTATLGNVLEELSSIAGFSVKLTPHSLRRTVGVWERSLRKGLKDVSMKLGHANVAVTATSYLGLLHPVDVGGTVFNRQNDFLLALSLHPNVAQQINESARSVPVEDRVLALQKVKVVWEIRRRGAVEPGFAMDQANHGVTYAGLFDQRPRWLRDLEGSGTESYYPRETTANLPVENALEACSVFRQRLIEENGFLIDAPDEEGEHLANLYEAWRTAAQTVLLKRGHAIEIPLGADVDFDSDAMALLLLMEEDNDDQAGRVGGEEQAEDAFEEEDGGEDDDHDDNKYNKDDDEDDNKDDDKDDRYEDDEDDVEMDKGTDDEGAGVADETTQRGGPGTTAHTPVSGLSSAPVTNEVDWETVIDPRLLELDRKATSRDVGDQLSMCADILFKPCSGLDQFLAALDLCAGLPETSSQIVGYRPGTTPTSGSCTGCNQLLEAVVEPHKQISNYRSACIRHVRSCTAKKSLDRIVDSLLEIFPSKLDKHPFLQSEYAQKQEARSKKPQSLFVHDVQVRTSNRYKGQRGFEVSLTCAVCNEDLPSKSRALAHLCSRHDIFLPTNAITAAIKGKMQNGEWDREMIGLPKPRFYYFDNSYHPDPRDLEIVSEEFYKSRISKDVSTTGQYGCRTDLTFTVAQLAAIKCLKDAPADTKYETILGKHYNVLQQGLGILSCTDPLLSYTDRMVCFEDSASIDITSRMACLRGVYATCIEYWRNQLFLAGDDLPHFGLTKPPTLSKTPVPRKLPLRKPFIIDVDGDVACPDLVCKKFKLKFDGLLTLTWHLVGVHKHPVSSVAVGLSQDATLKDVCFINEKELETFLGCSEGGFARDATSRKATKKRAEIRCLLEVEAAAKEKKRKKRESAAKGKPGRKKKKQTAAVHKSQKGKQHADQDDEDLDEEIDEGDDKDETEDEI